jgi:hypothetical protein
MYPQETKSVNMKRPVFAVLLLLALIFIAIPLGSATVKGDDSPYTASAEVREFYGCTLDTTTGTLTVTENDFSFYPEYVDKI